MKPDIEQKIKNLLSSANLRRTGPRAAVLSVLLGARKPQTAQQIAAKLSHTTPNKVTIYRILESFLSAGLVHKVFLQQRSWHFELSHNCTKKGMVYLISRYFTFKAARNIPTPLAVNIIRITNNGR